MHNQLKEKQSKHWQKIYKEEEAYVREMDEKLPALRLEQEREKQIIEADRMAAEAEAK